MTTKNSDLYIYWQAGPFIYLTDNNLYIKLMEGTGDNFFYVPHFQ